MKPERLLQLGVVALLTLFVFLIYSSVREVVVQAGDTAPAFSLTSDDGKKFTTTDFGGKILLLNFWANWCPPCVEETPSLVQLSKQLGSKGLVVLGVSIDGNEAAYKRFVQRFSIPFSVYRDGEQKINYSYGTLQIPESYLIDRNGRVVRKIIGPADFTAPDLVEYVQSLL